MFSSVRDISRYQLDVLSQTQAPTDHYAVQHLYQQQITFSGSYRTEELTSSLDAISPPPNLIKAYQSVREAGFWYVLKLYDIQNISLMGHAQSKWFDG
jgi:hypothetical protein